MTSRRSFLTIAILPNLLRATGRGTLLPSTVFHYADVATELPITRLTNPVVSSLLPPAEGNPISHRNTTLLYSSDASGAWQAYRMDLKKGEAQQITDAEALDPSSLSTLPGERGFCYWDNSRLMAASFDAGGSRQLYKASQGFDAGRGVNASVDRMYTAMIEKRGNTHRLRLISTSATTLVEADEELRAPLIRPRRASVLYLRGGGLYLVNFDGKQNYRLHVTNGTVAQAAWSPDGRSVFYLNIPGEGKLNAIREFLPDTNEDHLVAETTQFAAFARNADASVFAGASGSKASPYILLLVRAVKRELTLCEHRASDPAMAAPVFSPNSQQIFFASDLHGKPAIYRIDVAKLVAETVQADSKGR